MNKRLMKILGLCLMLGLCLALTGCWVAPEDLSGNEGYTVSGNNSLPYQSVGPRITATPTPYTAPTATPTPEPTYVWNTAGTPTPTLPGTIVSVTTPPSGIVYVTPDLSTPTPDPAASSVLKVGSKGDAVKELQKRLKELGYYKGSVDGDFGTGTETAVKAFQAQNSLTVDGAAGTGTLNRLYGDNAKKAPSSVTATPRRTATPTPRATSVPDTDVYLEVGSTGTKVRTLQSRLIELGWMAGKADGVFDGATEYAVKAFQQKYTDLYDDGVAGPGTLTRMYSERASKSSSPVSSIGETLQEGQSSDAVKAMQKRLKALGFLSGAADGSFGQATKAAVIAFQTANGLSADGRAGTATLNKLYSANAKGAESLNNNGTNAGSGASVNGYTTLREGDEGEAVRKLQQALKNRGYYSGSIDGRFGSGTVAAVTAFQQRNGLTVDGAAGPMTLTILYGNNAASANTYATLRPGDNSTAVRNMQSTLYELGYYDGSIDGKYGNTTEDAVRAFQIRNNISPVDGIAGNKTLQALYSSNAIGASAALTQYTTLRKGDQGSKVVELQECLVSLGYLSEATGYYDNATVEAVKNFQRRNGLSADGSAGQETLSVLYGSNPRTAY